MISHTQIINCQDCSVLQSVPRCKNIAERNSWPGSDTDWNRLAPGADSQCTGRRPTLTPHIVWSWWHQSPGGSGGNLVTAAPSDHDDDIMIMSWSLMPRSVVTGQGSDHVRPCEALGRDLLCSITLCTPCSLQWAALMGDFPRKTTAKLRHLLNMHVLLVVVLPDKVKFWSNFASANCYCSRNFAICVSVSNKKMKFY